MANLFKQRKLVKDLDCVSKESMKNSSEHMRQSSNSTFKEVYIMINEGDHYIFENELLNYLLQRYKRNQDDIDFITDYKRVLQSCIEDNFILADKNEDFCESNIDHINTSQRKIQVSYDKGEEILSPVYFWWKYIAGVFPSLTHMVVTIITAVLTSGAIWLFLLKVVGIEIG
ncbi:MAG: hypothetical protein ACOCU8_01465 [Patescibacteria group bacterium]